MRRKPLLSLTIVTLVLLVRPSSVRADVGTTTVNDTAALNITVAASNDTGVRLTAMYNPATTTASSVVMPEVVVTLTVIGGCGLLGLGIAKLGDYCYDRRMATRDDISNASEYTKNILRTRMQGTKQILKTRLAVMKMKSDPPTEDGKTIKAAASAWIETATKDKPDKAKSSADLPSNDKNPTEKDVEVGDARRTVDEAASMQEPTPSVTVTTPPISPLTSASPIPNNKVSPAMSRERGDVSISAAVGNTQVDAADTRANAGNTRANALPPINRPKTPVRAINQPIRSTR